MTVRALAMMLVLVAVTVSDARVGLSAAIVFALAYTVELGAGLVAYFSGGGTASSGSAIAGTSVTEPSSVPNVLSSSWAIHPARSNHWHNVQ